MAIDSYLEKKEAHWYIRSMELMDANGKNANKNAAYKAALS